MGAYGSEASAGMHIGEFVEGVGIAGDGGGEHGHAEGGCLGRRDAIFVGNELESCNRAAGLKRAANFLEQRDAGVSVEVMKEIGEKDDVVGSGKIDFEGAAGKHVIALLNAGYFCVVESYAKNRSPVKTGDVSVWILDGDFDAEEAVASGDIEDLHLVLTTCEDDSSERGGHGPHHRGHALRKLDPHGIVRLDSSLSGKNGPAVPNDFCEILEGLTKRRLCEEADDGSEATGGGGIEKRSA